MCWAPRKAKCQNESWRTSRFPLFSWQVLRASTCYIGSLCKEKTPQHTECESISHVTVIIHQSSVTNHPFFTESNTSWGPIALAMYPKVLTSRSKVQWRDIPWLSHWRRKRLKRNEEDLFSKAHETSPKRRWTILIHFLSCFAQRTLLFKGIRYPWSPLDISPNSPPGRPPLAQDLLLSRNSWGSRAEARRIAFLCASLKGFESVGETTGNVVGQKHEVFSTRECMAELLCIRIPYVSILLYQYKMLV